MANTHITIDQFENLLKRVEKLEYRTEEVDVDEVKERYYKIEKEVAVTDTKIDSLEKVMNERFNTVDERFNTVDEKINSLRTELRVTFGILLTVMIAIGIKIFASSI